MSITRCPVWVENSAPGRQWSCEEGHGWALPGTRQLQSMPEVGLICSRQKHRTAAKLLTTPTQRTRHQTRLKRSHCLALLLYAVWVPGQGNQYYLGSSHKCRFGRALPCLLTRLQIIHYTLTSGTPCFSGEGHHLTQSNSNSWCFYLFRWWFFFLKLF